MADNQFIKIMNLRHPCHLRLKNQTDKLSFRNPVQAITQCAHIIYAARVGAALAVAPMQGGGKPRPYRFSGKCLRGSKRKLYPYYTKTTRRSRKYSWKKKIDYQNEKFYLREQQKAPTFAV